MLVGVTITSNPPVMWHIQIYPKYYISNVIYWGISTLLPILPPSLARLTPFLHLYVPKTRWIWLIYEAVTLTYTSNHSCDLLSKIWRKQCQLKGDGHIFLSKLTPCAHKTKENWVICSWVSLSHLTHPSCDIYPKYYISNVIYWGISTFLPILPPSLARLTPFLASVGP